MFTHIHLNYIKEKLSTPKGPTPSDKHSQAFVCVATIQIEPNTVKPVFKGHSDEGTPCDQGTLSQNGVLSSPC